MSHDDQEPDKERVQRRATDRRHERTEIVEDTIDRVGKMLGEHKYPVTGEELAVEYADETLDLPNETESLGSVFDRLVDERFESAAEAREAVVNELTGQEGGMTEYNDQRELDRIAEENREVDTPD